MKNDNPSNSQSKEVRGEGIRKNIKVAFDGGGGITESNVHNPNTDMVKGGSNNLGRTLNTVSLSMGNGTLILDNQ